MRKKLYLTGIEKRPGKSFVSLGFLAMLKEQSSSLKCFKLFSEADESQIPLLEDISEQTIKSLMSFHEAIGLMQTAPADLIAAILEATHSAENTSITYFEGTDFKSDHDIFEYQFNLMLAQQLNCDVILVLSAKDRTLEHSLTLLINALEISTQNHAHVVGVIINQVANAKESEALEFFETHFPGLCVIVLPEFETLAHPSMRDIAVKLGAQVIAGEKELHRAVRQFTVAAKTIGNFLESRLSRNGMLIITPDDRIDILLGSLLADQSTNYPKIAGIVLTGGEMPGPIIREILAGLEYTFPVLLTDLKTYETATFLFSARFSLSKADSAKVSKALDSMRPYLIKPLLKLLSHKSRTPGLRPAVFLHEISTKAKQMKQHIVLPEGEDPRILTAADYVLKRQIVKITLLGKAEKILLQAKRLGLDLPEVNIIDLEETSGVKESYAQKYYELRKHKNVNLPIAIERMTDLNYFAAMMVFCADADGMVSGAAHTTADTVRPALEIIKTKPGIKKVSSVFIMCMPSRVLIYGDCAINPEPDSQTLAEIAIQAANIAKILGINPKVALLSYSSGDSGKGESVEKVVKALDILKLMDPNLLVEGPIQYDAAVDPEVAIKKLPNSKLLGDANVLIFPDLNTGNNTYKAVQRESGALAIGPVLLGLNKPVNDLSRGCTPEDIINTILVTAIQSQGDKK
jgi:phosphate acetyltransferase